MDDIDNFENVIKADMLLLLRRRHWGDDIPGRSWPLEFLHTSTVRKMHDLSGTNLQRSKKQAPMNLPS